MSENQTIKRDHELAVGNALLKALEIDARFEGYGRDGYEPDVIYDMSGKRVGIEVATAYYQEHQAKIEWSMARRKDAVASMQPLFEKILEEPDRQMFVTVQAEINDKCSKKYGGVDESWLCIEMRAHITNIDEARAMVEEWNVPQNEFSRIYLTMHASHSDGGGYQVFDLHPTHVRGE